MPSISAQTIVNSISLFFTVLLLATAAFCGFAPYDWVCAFYSSKSGTTCTLRHSVIFAVSVALFMLSIITYHQFQFTTMFVDRG